MEDFYDDNPTWLQQNIVKGTFNWDESFQTTFEEFLTHVIFHDSHWIGVNINGYMEFTCIIRLDSFWNKEYSQADKYDNEWHFCLINIENVKSFTINKFDDCDSKTIGNCESKTIDNYSTTKFDNTCGGLIELVHKPIIKILLITEKGEYLDSNPIT